MTEEPHVRSYEDNGDGTVSFKCHHMCSTTYGFSKEMTKREVDYITKYMSSTAGEFLTSLIEDDEDPFGSELLEIKKVSISCGISELDTCRHTLFNTYYDKVSYNFIITLHMKTKIPMNHIKLKRPDFFTTVTSNSQEILNEINMESPVVFIEEFIFGDQKTKRMFKL